jgi:hypothetical protein
MNLFIEKKWDIDANLVSKYVVYKICEGGPSTHPIFANSIFNTYFNGNEKAIFTGNGNTQWDK